ncbi:MAG: HAD domain-containing protein [bacterium]|nr:HAD domain-containing protein [bacterium]
MAQKRVLFLDIEGVLVNRASILAWDPYRFFDSPTVVLLKNVVEKCQLELVISSDWRKKSDWLLEIQICFRKAGWRNPPIIGKTGISHCRGEEIQNWLKENPVEAFAILDDTMFGIYAQQEPRFVQCDTELGLTEAEATELIKLFSS